MNTSKIIKAYIGAGTYSTTEPITQGDYGYILQIEGAELPAIYRVDFSNDRHKGEALPVYGNENGAEVPEELIVTGKDIFAFYYYIEEGFGKTAYTWKIPNDTRAQNGDRTPTPTQQDSIDQLIVRSNEAVERAEDAQQAIEDMSVSATTLAEGESATVTKTEQEGVVHLTFGIPPGATGAKVDKGDKGDKGDTGAQGIQGIQGERGLQGDKGEKGDKGDKGDTGATGAQGIQGAKGDTGADGYSPTVTITPITGGHRITITDADGEHSADVMDGTGNVDDVQINGTSIVENGVANVPIASHDTFGVIKILSTNGTIVDRDGALRISYAYSDLIKRATGQGALYQPIVPYNQHESTFYGLAKAAGDITQSQSSNAVGNYTEDAKVAIQKMLGLYREWELIADVTVEEDSIQVDITTDLNGQAFELSEMFVQVWLKPSTTGANDYITSKGFVTFSNDTTNTTWFPTLRYMASGAQTFMEFKAELIDGVSFVTGSSRSNPNTTNALQTISGESGGIKYYHGFRIGRFSSAMSLIPAGTHIVVKGIRCCERSNL